MSKKKSFDYEKSMARLEEIIARFDAGGMTLDEMEAHFVEGMQLIEQCSDRLNQLETKVNQLLDNGETAAWDGDQEEGG